MRSVLLTLLLSLCAFPQLAPPNSAGVSMGHLHFNTRDPEAHRRFWTLLGAKPLKPLLANDVYQVPNALILVRKHDVSGGTVGSIVDHIGFRVADLDGMVEKVQTGRDPHCYAA